jgi:hypothetical protein
VGETFWVWLATTHCIFLVEKALTAT